MVTQGDSHDRPLFVDPKARKIEEERKRILDKYSPRKPPTWTMPTAFLRKYSPRKETVVQIAPQREETDEEKIQHFREAPGPGAGKTHSLYYSLSELKNEDGEVKEPTEKKGKKDKGGGDDAPVEQDSRKQKTDNASKEKNVRKLVLNPTEEKAARGPRAAVMEMNSGGRSDSERSEGSGTEAQPGRKWKEKKETKEKKDLSERRKTKGLQLEAHPPLTQGPPSMRQRRRAHVAGASLRSPRNKPEGPGSISLSAREYPSDPMLTPQSGTTSARTTKALLRKQASRRAMNLLAPESVDEDTVQGTTMLLSSRKVAEKPRKVFSMLTPNYLPPSQKQSRRNLSDAVADKDSGKKDSSRASSRGNSRGGSRGGSRGDMASRGDQRGVSRGKSRESRGRQNSGLDPSSGRSSNLPTPPDKHASGSRGRKREVPKRREEPKRQGGDSDADSDISSVGIPEEPASEQDADEATTSEDSGVWSIQEETETLRSPLLAAVDPDLADIDLLVLQGIVQARNQFFTTAANINKKICLQGLRPKDTRDPEAAFIAKCNELHISPRPVTQRTPGGVFQLGSYGLGHHMVQALSSHIEKDKELNALNLSDNGLNAKGCEAIALAVHKQGLIRELDLANNRVGDGLRALYGILDSLTTLNLKGNTLAQASAVKLFKHLRRNTALTSLNLSRTGIGVEAGLELARMVHNNRSLEELDVSWNAVRGAAGSALSASLAHNTSLKHMDLSWNHIAGGDLGDTLCLSLEQNTTLESLNIGHTCLDERNCVTLSSALLVNTSLRNLDIEGNKVGRRGMTCLLEAMATRGPKDLDLNLLGCNCIALDTEVFDVLSPDDYYELDLSIPYERAVASTLYRLGATNATANKEQICTVPLPDSGIRELVCVLAPRPPNPVDTHVLDFVASVLDDAHMPPVAGALVEQNALVLFHSAARLWLFNWLVVKELLGMLTQTATRVALFCTLFPWVEARVGLEQAEASLTAMERRMVKEELQTSYDFDPGHCSGHYRLDLSRPRERDVCCRVLMVGDADKRRRTEDERLPDTSQTGTWENFRNGVYRGKPHEVLSTWKPPAVGIVEFDYVSTWRLSEAETPISNTAYEQFCLQFLRTAVKGGYDALKATVRQHWFSAAQAARLVAALDDLDTIVRVTVDLYGQVVDLDNFLRELDKRLEPPQMNEVIHRLGWLNLWNPSTPDRTYELDLGERDHYIVADGLFALNAAESPIDGPACIQDLKYKQRTTSVSEMLKGAGLPHEGVLTLTYKSTTPNVSVRRDQLRKTLMYNPEKLAAIVKAENEKAASEARAAEMDRRKKLAQMRKHGSRVAVNVEAVTPEKPLETVPSPGVGRTPRGGNASPRGSTTMSGMTFHLLKKGLQAAKAQEEGDTPPTPSQRWGKALLGAVMSNARKSESAFSSPTPDDGDGHLPNI